MKVCSFNIWSDAPVNARWAKRRELVADILRRTAPDVAGLQEATLAMIRDLHERLPGYSWLGVGRDDGLEIGEYNPIFFRTSEFRVIKHASFWLSANCEKPGRGWDAACPRIVTWAHFAHAESGRQFSHFNTHFDHLGRKSRSGSARLLLQKIAEIAGADPTVITGDFNCRESSLPYRILTGRTPFADAGDPPPKLHDTFHHAGQPPEGPPRTYLGLLGLLGLGRIDYVFVNDGFRTLRHIVMESAPGASDHRPVVAELDFASAIS